MKKQVYLSLSFAALIGAANAQTGNVGIGTTTPGTKLDVNGAITNRETAVAVAANAATVPANVSQVQLTGAATAAVVITAPAAPNAGQRLIIYNNTTGGFSATLGGFVVPNGQAMEFTYSNSAWQATNGGAIGGDFDWMKSGNAFPNSPGDTAQNIYHIGGNVGIGVAAPASNLHVVGGVTIADGTQGAGKLFVSDATGLGSWQSPAQTKEIMALGNVTTQGVLSGVAAGGSSTLTNFTQLVNSITGASFNAATDVVTLPVGTYEVAVSYELTAPGTCPAAGFLINSYFIDFPNNGTTMRVHANSPSICGTNSIHSALWVTTVTIPAGGQNWTMHIGRGAGGNYTDATNVVTTSRVLIKKIL